METSVRLFKSLALCSLCPGTTPQINGLYIHGGVGCGKTMIMDQFYDEIQSESKLRTHFHDFMLDVHERIHKYKSSYSREELRRVNTVYKLSLFLLF